MSRTMVDCRGSVAVSPVPRQVGDGWVLDAVLANGQVETIEGFGTQAEAREWPGSADHALWLRDNHVSLEAHLGLAALRTLERSALVIELIALTLVELARHVIHRVRSTSLGAAAGRAVAAVARASDLAFAVMVSRLPQQLHKAPRAGERRRPAPQRRRARRRGLVAVALLLAVAVITVRARGTDQPAGSDLTADTQVTVVAKSDRSRPVEATGATDPIALLLERLSSPGAEPARQADVAVEPAPPIEATAEPPVPPSAQGNDGEREVTPPRRDPRPSGRPAIVGVWIPEPGPCSARNPREGLLQAVISTHGARAGETSCVFKDQKQAAGDWLMRANCSNPHESWTTNVRLSVKGDRLIWTSKRGTQVYTRCRANV
jgi:hypothetical protein